MTPLAPAHRWLARVGLVLAGSLMGLLAAELLARVVAPAGHADLLFNAPDTTPDGLYVVDHDLMLVPRPGFSAVSHGLGSSVPLRINALGLRGEEVRDDAGDKQGPRWLAIGDSFTMSTQVPEAQSFEALLAARLTQDGTPTQVFNAGVDGYSTWQATGRYRKLGGQPGTPPDLALDGVLLTFFLGNDLQDNERFPTMLPEARRRPQGSPIPRPVVSPVESWLTRSSFLYAHWRVRARARALAAGTDPALVGWRDELSIFTTDGAGRLRTLEPASRSALAALRDLVTQRRDRLVVAIAPPAFVVHQERVASTFSIVGLDPSHADLDAPARQLTRTLQQLGIAACDLTPALRQGAQTAPMYLTYDGHWTPQGHAVVADTIAACMEPL